MMMMMVMMVMMMMIRDGMIRNGLIYGFRHRLCHFRHWLHSGRGPVHLRPRGIA